MELKTCKSGLHQYDSVKKRCPDCQKIYDKSWELANIAKRKQQKQDLQAKRATHFKIYRQSWKAQNPTYSKNYKKTRYINDLNFKLREQLRSRLSRALKDNYKSGSAIQDLGCTIDELKTYLESKFQPGMTWENQGRKGWHIDHIKPLSKFDLTNKEEFLKACHYTNLQPLWAVDNIKKGNK